MEIYYPNSIDRLPHVHRHASVIHRFTENLQETVDKLWKGVASAFHMRVTDGCLIFNQIVKKA